MSSGKIAAEAFTSTELAITIFFTRRDVILKLQIPHLLVQGRALEMQIVNIAIHLHILTR